MYRKTVAKRLFKTLPLISADINELLDRDNEQFVDMAAPRTVSSVAQDVQAARTEPIEGTVEPAKKPKKKKVAAKKKEPEPEDIPAPPPESDDGMEPVDPLADF